MVIIFDCRLTEPPSSINCFRDVTLYSNVFLKNENLIKCPIGTRSIYWRWIKSFGAQDFVEQLLKEGEHQDGITVGADGYIRTKEINASNYSDLLAKMTLIGRR